MKKLTAIIILVTFVLTNSVSFAGNGRDIYCKMRPVEPNEAKDVANSLGNALGVPTPTSEKYSANALGLPESIITIIETTKARLRESGIDPDAFEKYALPEARELSHIAHQDSNVILDKQIFQSSIDALERFFIKLKENNIIIEPAIMQHYTKSIVIISKNSQNKSEDFSLNLDALADLFIKLREKNMPANESLEEGIRLIARVATSQEIFRETIKFTTNQLAGHGINPGLPLRHGVYITVRLAHDNLQALQGYLSRVKELTIQIQNPEEVWPLFTGEIAISAMNLENKVKLRFHPLQQPYQIAPDGYWASQGPGREHIWLSRNGTAINPKPAWLEVVIANADAIGKQINTAQANSMGDELEQHPIYQILRTVFTSPSDRRSEGELRHLIETEAAEYGVDPVAYLNNDIFNQEMPTPEYVDRIRKKNPPKIVVQSGGNGSTFAIRVAKELGLTVCSLSPVSDDGGGSGEIREDLNTEPPGDLGYQLSSLADPAVRAITHQRIEDDIKVDGSKYTAPELFTEILINLLDGQESEYNLLLASRAEGLKPIAFMRDILKMAQMLKNTSGEKVFNSRLRLKGQTIQNLIVTTCLQVAGAIPDEKGIVDENRQKVAEFLAAKLMQIPPKRGYAIATCLGPFAMDTNRLFAIYEDVLPVDLTNRWLNPEHGHIRNRDHIRTILWNGKPRTMIIGEANFGEATTRHNSKIIFNGVLQGNQYTRIVRNREDAATVLSEELNEEDKLKANPAAAWAINSASDAIIIAPGSPLTSIWPIISTPEVLAANIAAKKRGIPIIQFINPMHTNEDLNLSLRDFFELTSKTVSFRVGTNVSTEDWVTDIVINDYENTPRIVRRVLSGERVLYLGEDVWDPKSRGIYNVTAEDIAYLKETLGEKHIHIAPLVHLFRSSIVGNGVTQHAYRANYIVRMTSDYIKDILQRAALARDGSAKASGITTNPINANSIGNNGQATKEERIATEILQLLTPQEKKTLYIWAKEWPLSKDSQKNLKNILSKTNKVTKKHKDKTKYGIDNLLHAEFRPELIAKLAQNDPPYTNFTEYDNITEIIFYGLSYAERNFYFSDEKRKAERHQLYKSPGKDKEIKTIDAKIEKDKPKISAISKKIDKILLPACIGHKIDKEDIRDTWDNRIKTSLLNLMAFEEKELNAKPLHERYWLIVLMNLGILNSPLSIAKSATVRHATPTKPTNHTSATTAQPNNHNGQPPTTAAAMGKPVIEKQTAVINLPKVDPRTEAIEKTVVLANEINLGLLEIAVNALAVNDEETKQRKAVKTTVLLIANSDNEILDIIRGITQNGNRTFEKIIPMVKPTQEEIDAIIYTENIGLVINYTTTNYGYGSLLAENIIKPQTLTNISETIEKVEQWL